MELKCRVAAGVLLLTFNGCCREDSEIYPF